MNPTPIDSNILVNQLSQNKDVNTSIPKPLLSSCNKSDKTGHGILNNSIVDDFLRADLGASYHKHNTHDLKVPSNLNDFVDDLLSADVGAPDSGQADVSVASHEDNTHDLKTPSNLNDFVDDLLSADVGAPDSGQNEKVEIQNKYNTLQTKLSANLNFLFGGANSNVEFFSDVTKIGSSTRIENPEKAQHFINNNFQVIYDDENLIAHVSRHSGAEEGSTTPRNGKNYTIAFLDEEDEKAFHEAFNVFLQAYLDQKEVKKEEKEDKKTTDKNSAPLDSKLATSSKKLSEDEILIQEKRKQNLGKDSLILSDIASDAKAAKNHRIIEKETEKVEVKKEFRKKVEARNIREYDRMARFRNYSDPATAHNGFGFLKTHHFGVIPRKLLNELDKP